MKYLGIWTGTTNASFTNRIPKMDHRISGINDTIEIQSIIKDNIEPKKKTKHPTSHGKTKQIRIAKTKVNNRRTSRTIFIPDFKLQLKYNLKSGML